MKPKLVLSIAAAAVLLLTRPARADGTFVSRNHAADVREPGQKALIVFDGSHEDLLLSVKFSGAPSTFGWIVPLPSEPEVSVGDASVFDLLSDRTYYRRIAPPPRYVHASAGGEVDVLRRETVGIYDVAVVGAGTGKSLTEWLDSNGFREPADPGGVLEDYALRGWVFVAMRIDPRVAPDADTVRGRAMREGTIQPIRLRFDTHEAIYPLRISSLLPGGSKVLLYVLSDRQLAPANLSSLPWAVVRVDRNGLLRTLVPAKSRSRLDGELALSQWRAMLTPSDMTEDLVFREATPAELAAEEARAVDPPMLPPRRTPGAAVQAPGARVEAGGIITSLSDRPAPRRLPWPVSHPEDNR